MRCLGASYTRTMQDFSAALDFIEKLVAMGARSVRLDGEAIEVSFVDPGVSPFDVLGSARDLPRDEEPSPEEALYYSAGG